MDTPSTEHDEKPKVDPSSHAINGIESESEGGDNVSLNIIEGEL